jgi:glutamyl-tRNA synthetase
MYTKYVTRIAPSPTGLFHLGTARTAYINYLAARASNGTFILRIDDTDVQRNRKEYIQIILDTMDWLELDYDKIYYQSDRIGLYEGEAKGLLANNRAIKLENKAVALTYPHSMPETFNDTIAGNIKITDRNKEQIEKKLILLRGINDDPEKTNTPTYQLASVIDDYFMGVNWIIRGVDHISNTPKQIAIWQCMNEVYGNISCPKEYPKFTHLGLITKDGKKLSKRDGAASLLSYRERGYSPKAILNWMLLLGWSLNVPRGNKQLEKIANSPIDKSMAIELFFQGKLKNSPCNFSMDKLNSLNKAYK